MEKPLKASVRAQEAGATDTRESASPPRILRGQLDAGGGLESASQQTQVQKGVASTVQMHKPAYTFLPNEQSP